MKAKKVLINNLSNFLLSFIVSTFLVSQVNFQNLKFKHLTVDDGLPQSVINNVFKDSRGFYWINEYKLSSNESEVLNHLCNGLSYKMVADKMCISYFTVNNHVKKVYEKLQVHSLGEALAKIKLYSYSINLCSSDRYFYHYCAPSIYRTVPVYSAIKILHPRLDIF